MSGYAKNRALGLFARLPVSHGVNQMVQALFTVLALSGEWVTLGRDHLTDFHGGSPLRKQEKMRVPIKVLLVEDNPGDVRLTREAFLEVNSSIQLHVANDGIEAMAFLRNEGTNDPLPRPPRPDFILLDLNLPKMDGRQVLAEIKSDRLLKSIPIFILSTSKDGRDIRRSYQLQANCYLCKPVDLQSFQDLIQSINDFWLIRVALPQLSLNQ